MIKYLLSKASTGKFRVVYLSTTEEWDEEKAGFVINRVTGQLHGKMTEQPEIVITKGKAGRTHREQLELQFKSELKKYLDKGYKEMENDPETYSETQLEEFYGDIKTDQNGFAEHMLAKSADRLKNPQSIRSSIGMLAEKLMELGVPSTTRMVRFYLLLGEGEIMTIQQVISEEMRNCLSSSNLIPLTYLMESCINMVKVSNKSVEQLVLRRTQLTATGLNIMFTTS